MYNSIVSVYQRLSSQVLIKSLQKVTIFEPILTKKHNINIFSLKANNENKAKCKTMFVQMYFSYFVNGFSILGSTALVDSTASVIPAALNPLRMISFWSQR